jgi:hypothetical protein
VESYASDEETLLFKRLSSQPADPDILDEVDEAAAHAISQLGLLRDSEPQAIASAIRTHVDAVRPLSGEELDETAIVLAALWAEQVRRALNWEWVELKKGRKSVGYGIVSPDRALVTLPILYMRELLADAARDNTVLLLFNMLVAGNVPPSAPGELKEIS